MIVTIDTDHATPPAGGFASDAAYVEWVMAMAAQSYQHQYATATPDAGIAAARAAYNASLPAPAEDAE
jgi:hypothetical protein